MRKLILPIFSTFLSLLVLLNTEIVEAEEYQDTITAIKTKGIVLVDKADIIDNGIIIIKNNLIVAVGQHIPIPENAKIIDLSDSYISPGLMDLHTHLSWHIYQKSPSNGYLLSIVSEPTAYRALQGARNAADMLMSGFTTVRDVGNAANYADTALREAVEDGLVIGPSIYNAGRIISPFGGQRQVQPERPDFTQPEYFFADTQDEIKKAIRQNIHYGAKLIKLVVDDQDYIYSVEDIKFAVKEAKLAGRRVAAHASTQQGAINAIKAKVASVEHWFGINEEVLRLAKSNNVPIVSTTFPLKLLKIFYDNKDMTALPEKVYPKSIAILKKAREYGVEVPFGTDVIQYVSDQNRGEAALSFIQSYLDAGYKSDEILKAMTFLAAKVIGIEKSRGLLQKGYIADLIATKENPLTEISALTDVHLVMKEGVIYKRNGKQIKY